MSLDWWHLYTGRHDAEFDTRAQLLLKDGVIKALSHRIAHMQFALDEAKAGKEKDLEQPAIVTLQQVRVRSPLVQLLFDVEAL